MAMPRYTEIISSCESVPSCTEPDLCRCADFMPRYPGRRTRYCSERKPDTCGKFNQRVAPRDGCFAVAASSPEKNPAQDGNVVVPANGAPHSGHRERGLTMDSCFGRREMQTFKKLPNEQAKEEGSEFEDNDEQCSLEEYTV